MVILRILLILSLLIAVLLSRADAQGYVDVLPDEVKQPFQDRYQRISDAVAKFHSNEWVGIYYRDVAITQSETLVWEPDLGFAAYSDTCSNGPRAWVNYGTVKFNNGVLTLSPQRDKTAKFVLNLPHTELTPIRWGEQHWLVPTAELTLFACTVNSRSGEEESVGYLKADDSDKHQSARPELPPQYEKLLGMPRIRAAVIDIGKNRDRWDFPITINAGKNKGVIEGMSFWLVGQKGIDVEVYVDEVRERVSIVSPAQIGGSADYGKEIVPAVGWRFTSRFPWASSARR